ncbi:MAG: LysE family translocator [Burkholderiaceae bacterium]
MTIDFLLTSLVVILLPGTGVLYTIAVGLGQGMRASVIAALGCTLGIVWHIAASIAGLAALMHTSASAFQILKVLGVAYLFYMAWSILRDQGPLDVDVGADADPTKNQLPAWRIIRNGILLNFFNPKLTLFFFAFLPQFVPAQTIHPTALLLGLALMFMLMTFIVFIGYGFCASYAREYVISRPTVLLWLKRSFAGAFGLLGLKLALSRQ